MSAEHLWRVLHSSRLANVLTSDRADTGASQNRDNGFESLSGRSNVSYAGRHVLRKSGRVVHFKTTSRDDLKPRLATPSRENGEKTVLTDRACRSCGNRHSRRVCKTCETFGNPAMQGLIWNAPLNQLSPTHHQGGLCLSSCEGARSSLGKEQAPRHGLAGLGGSEILGPL